MKNELASINLPPVLCHFFLGLKMNRHGTVLLEIESNSIIKLAHSGKFILQLMQPIESIYINMAFCWNSTLL